jgi:hypothetical protein
MLNIGIALEDVFEVVDHLARRIDRGALWQREIDKQLGPVRAREELLLHELHADESHDEQRSRRTNYRIFHVQHAIDHALEGASEARWLAAVTL